MLHHICICLVDVFVRSWVWDIIGDLFALDHYVSLWTEHSFIKYVVVIPM